MLWSGKFLRYKFSKVAEIFGFPNCLPDSFRQVSFINFYKDFMAQLHLYMIELIPKVVISVHNCCIDQKGLYQIEVFIQVFWSSQDYFFTFFLNYFHILKQLMKLLPLKKKRKKKKQNAHLALFSLLPS